MLPAPARASLRRLCDSLTSACRIASYTQTPALVKQAMEPSCECFWQASSSTAWQCDTYCSCNGSTPTLTSGGPRLPGAEQNDMYTSEPTCAADKASVMQSLADVGSRAASNATCGAGGCHSKGVVVLRAGGCSAYSTLTCINSSPHMVPHSSDTEGAHGGSALVPMRRRAVLPVAPYTSAALQRHDAAFRQAPTPGRQSRSYKTRSCSNSSRLYVCRSVPRMLLLLALQLAALWSAPLAVCGQRESLAAGTGSGVQPAPGITGRAVSPLSKSQTAITTHGCRLLPGTCPYRHACA